MTKPLSLPKRIGLGVLSILVAAAIWLPSLHFFFRESAPGPTGIHPKARKIAARQIELWTNAPRTISRSTPAASVSHTNGHASIPAKRTSIRVRSCRFFTPFSFAR